MIFGSKHERFVADDPTHPQLSLNLPSEAIVSVVITAIKQISYTRQTVNVETKPLQHPGRMKLPESLRREEILIGTYL